MSGLNISLDYSRFCGIVSREEWLDINEYIRARTGLWADYSNAHPTKIGKWYEKSGRSECGGLATAINTMHGGEMYDITLQLSGTGMATMSMIEQIDYFKYLVDKGLHCTRLDMAIDDYEWGISTDELEAAIRDKNIKHQKTGTIIKGFYDNSYTYGFGARSSPRYVRLYNKMAESGGKTNCQRLEAEYKGELARDMGYSLANWVGAEGKLTTYIARCVVGSIDFIDRSHDTNISRCPRLAWWQAFVDRVGEGIRPAVSPVVTTIEKSKNWIATQVRNTLAMIREAISYDEFYTWIEGELALAQADLSARHYDAITRYRELAGLDREIIPV